ECGELQFGRGLRPAVNQEDERILLRLGISRRQDQDTVRLEVVRLPGDSLHSAPGNVLGPGVEIGQPPRFRGRRIHYIQLRRTVGRGGGKGDDRTLLRDGDVVTEGAVDHEVTQIETAR